MLFARIAGRVFIPRESGALDDAVLPAQVVAQLVVEVGAVGAAWAGESRRQAASVHQVPRHARLALVHSSALGARELVIRRKSCTRSNKTYFCSVSETTFPAPTTTNCDKLQSGATAKLFIQASRPGATKLLHEGRNVHVQSQGLVAAGWWLR